MTIFNVNPTGSDSFFTFAGALKAAAQIDDQAEIRLSPGTYWGQITISVPGITVTGMGSSPADTVIKGNLSSREIMPDQKKRGTFRTYTLMVDAPYVTLKNLTVENTAGPGEAAGQAIALYVDGNGFHGKGCRFLGHQDTLFTAPLPPKEIEPDGFIGPKQAAPRINGTHYYENCYIEGGVDFIFGGAAAYFEGCTFCSNEPGFVFAPSTPQGRPYGYVCRDCRFTASWLPAAGVSSLPDSNPDGPVYLGRPWRNYAKTVLISCWIDRHIHPSGWDDWGKIEAQKTVLFAQYGCLGPGASTVSWPSWCTSLSKKDLPFYEKEQVLSEAINLL